MTTSVIDIENLKQFLPADLAAGIALSKPPSGEVVEMSKPVSGVELIKRIKETFTPEEAEALARRIEEGREQAHD